VQPSCATLPRPSLPAHPAACPPPTLLPLCCHPALPHSTHPAACPAGRRSSGWMSGTRCAPWASCGCTRSAPQKLKWRRLLKGSRQVDPLVANGPAADFTLGCARSEMGKQHPRPKQQEGSCQVQSPGHTEPACMYALLPSPLLAWTWYGQKGQRAALTGMRHGSPFCTAGQQGQQGSISGEQRK